MYSWRERFDRCRPEIEQRGVRLDALLIDPVQPSGVCEGAEWIRSRPNGIEWLADRRLFRYGRVAGLVKSQTRCGAARGGTA